MTDDDYLGLPGPHHDSGSASGLKRYTLGAIVGYVILLCGIGFAVHENRVIADEVRERQKITCQIQNRGLAAQDRLVGTMSDIRLLLSPLPGEKQPPPPAAVKAVVDDLNHELDQYLKIENTQPKNRPC